MKDKEKSFDEVTEQSVQMKKRSLFPLFLSIASVFMAAITVISVYVFVRGGTPATYDEKMDLGRKYLLELDYEQAAIAFEEAIKINPKKSDAYLELADVYVRQGNLEKALEILDKAEKKVTDEDAVRDRRDEIIETFPIDKPEENVISEDEELASIPEPLQINLDALTSGDIIVFGSYEQDNNFDNGREPIEWIVLENSDSEILLLSKYALDCQKYNDVSEAVTWEKCSLREWLNREFYNNAFNKKEKTWILDSELKNRNDDVYGTSGGNDTTDKVFLLSKEEASDSNYGFLSSYYDDIMRRCAPTAYAKAKGVNTLSSYEFMTSYGDYSCYWWLRSPGADSTRAAFVVAGGSVFVDEMAGNVETINHGIRPSIRIRKR